MLNMFPGNAATVLGFLLADYECLAACCCFDQVLLDMGPRGESGRGDQEGRRFALPENPHMPSARIFAECIISSTRQSYYLPSAKKHALGEQMALGGLSLCRVPVS